MDANPQAREAIAKGGNFEASMAQDFKGIGRTVADTVKRYLAGEKIKQSVIYVPTKLITEENVKRLGVSGAGELRAAINADEPAFDFPSRKAYGGAVALTRRLAEPRAPARCWR